MENKPKNNDELSDEILRLQSKLTELEKYEVFFKKAPLSYQSLNEDGFFVDVNPTWLKTLGYERNDVLGKKFSDFLHPDWQNYFDENFSALKKRGYVYDAIFKIKHKNGNFIDISLESCVDYKEDGSFKQTYCVFHDVSKRKEIEENLLKSIEREQVLADIIRNSPVAFAFGYPDGSLAQCNKAFEKLTGYSEKELKEIKWDEVLTPKKWRKKESDKLKKLCPENNYVRYEKEYIHKSGKAVPIELNVTAKYDDNGQLIHFIGFATDITERKKTEQEIEMHRKNLEELVEERTKELQNKNKELDNTLKVFVGREMLIRELQKKIKSLGGEL